MLRLQNLPAHPMMQPRRCELVARAVFLYLIGLELIGLYLIGLELTKRLQERQALRHLAPQCQRRLVSGPLTTPPRACGQRTRTTGPAGRT